MKRNKQTLILLTKDEHKKLKIEAIERNMSMSAIVRQAVKIYIEKYTMR